MLPYRFGFLPHPKTSKICQYELGQPHTVFLLFVSCASYTILVMTVRLELQHSLPDFYFYFLSLLFYTCSYFDLEAMVGYDDGAIRVFDMYSKRCSQIIRYFVGSPPPKFWFLSKYGQMLLYMIKFVMKRMQISYCSKMGKRSILIRGLKSITAFL